MFGSAMRRVTRSQFSFTNSFVFILCHHMSFTSAACFTPNGTDRNAISNAADGYYYLPCSPENEVSMCCGFGPGRPDDPDVCVDGGFCYNAKKRWYWRESCTDPTWQDPACIKLFLNGTGYGGTPPEYFVNGNGDPEIISDVAILPCTNGSWCEGVDNQACCDAGMGIFVDVPESNVQGSTAAVPTASRPITDSSQYYRVTITRSYPQLTQTATDDSTAPGLDVIDVTETVTTSFFAEDLSSASMSASIWAVTAEIPSATLTGLYASGTLTSADGPAPKDDGTQSSRSVPWMLLGVSLGVIGLHGFF